MKLSIFTTAILELYSKAIPYFSSRKLTCVIPSGPDSTVEADPILALACIFSSNVASQRIYVDKAHQYPSLPEQPMTFTLRFLRALHYVYHNLQRRPLSLILNGSYMFIMVRERQSIRYASYSRDTTMIRSPKTES